MPGRDDSPPTPPLKRHAALQPLSREHMSGLIQARALRRAAEGDRDLRRSAIDDFVRCWQEEIEGHFDDEERLLLPLTSDAALGERLLAEHGALRRFAADCQRDPAAAADCGVMGAMGALLHDHIRWEERVFFEAVQREHPEALAAMLDEAAQIEGRRPGARARPRRHQPTAPTHDDPTRPGGNPMTPDRLRQHPAERFATNCLLFDLGAEIAALRAEPSDAQAARASDQPQPPHHGHRQKTLYKHAGRTIALFIMSPGASLPEHAADGAVSIQTLEGELALQVDGAEQRVGPGAMLILAPGVRHDVRATTAAAFLLQISLER